MASADPHKNHRCLLKAWVILAEENLFPSLCLTIKEDTAPSLMKLIDQMKKEHRVSIKNNYLASPREVNRLYGQAEALIYPSTLESFGLPLIEARTHGLSIIASEMDYVRDVIDPEESFDPTSSISIARAVKRFLGVEEQPLKIVDAKSFLHKIFGDEGA